MHNQQKFMYCKNYAWWKFCCCLLAVLALMNVHSIYIGQLMWGFCKKVWLMCGKICALHYELLVLRNDFTCTTTFLRKCTQFWYNDKLVISILSIDSLGSSRTIDRNSLPIIMKIRVQTDIELGWFLSNCFEQQFPIKYKNILGWH